MWFYFCLVLAGIIAGLVIFKVTDGPDTTINENTSIGKIKLRGEGNSTIIPTERDENELAPPPSTRLERKEARLLRRLARIRERADKKEGG